MECGHGRRCGFGGGFRDNRTAEDGGRANNARETLLGRARQVRATGRTKWPIFLQLCAPPPPPMPHAPAPTLTHQTAPAVRPPLPSRPDLDQLK